MIPTFEQIKRATSGGYARFVATTGVRKDVYGEHRLGLTLDATIINSSQGVVQWRDANTGRVVTPRENWEFSRADGRPLDREDKKADDGTIATIGPYVVSLAVGADLKSRYVVRHADGGLVPTASGGFASEATFGAEREAKEHATKCFSALLSGQPSPFPRRRAA